jgi:hypothetical protein
MKPITRPESRNDEFPFLRSLHWTKFLENVIEIAKTGEICPDFHLRRTVHIEQQIFQFSWRLIGILPKNFFIGKA